MNKTVLRAILLEQRQEIDALFHDHMVPRDIIHDAKQHINDPIVHVIMGPRRSGKSVLAHQLLEGKTYGYVNFEDERLANIQTKDLQTVLEVMEELNSRLTHILLDEAQNVKGWELFASRLKRSGYRVLVTGSNAKLLSGELATHLTGRHLTIELLPFSFREFLSFRRETMSAFEPVTTKERANITRYLNEYLEWGAFPETFRLASKQNYLRELYTKILTVDIAARHSIKFVKTLKELAQYALSNYGSKITFQKLKHIFSIGSVHTVRNYMEYLQDAYLLYQVEPFSFKFKERVQAARKVYGIDTGMIRAVSTEFSRNDGRLFENTVFIELKRRGKEVYYYPHPQGGEVDFVIKKGYGVEQLIQVCANLEDPDIKKRELSALEKASRTLKCRNLLVITSDEEGEEKLKGKKIQFLPLWKWLLKR